MILSETHSGLLQLELIVMLCVSLLALRNTDEDWRHYQPGNIFPFVLKQRLAVFFWFPSCPSRFQVWKKAHIFLAWRVKYCPPQFPLPYMNSVCIFCCFYPKFIQSFHQENLDIETPYINQSKVGFSVQDQHAWSPPCPSCWGQACFPLQLTEQLQCWGNKRTDMRAKIFGGRAGLAKEKPVPYSCKPRILSKHDDIHM